MKFLKLFNKTLKSAAKILTFVFAVLFGLSIITVQICMANSTIINDTLKIRLTKTIYPEEGSDSVKTDTEYFKPSSGSVKEVLDNAADYCREVEEEGAVLLKNELVNIQGDSVPALPLGAGAKVSLFSASSVYPVLSGTGSSEVSKTVAGNNILLNAFKQAGLDVNNSLYSWYRNNANTYCRVSPNALADRHMEEINDAKWEQIPDSAKYASGYNDAAIYIISRSGGEGQDLFRNEGDKEDMTDGNYLILSPTEIDMLKNLKSQRDAGKFKRIIVILNSAYHVMGFANNEDYDIDALLWVGSFGSNGAEATAKIIEGTVKPSGRLSDTFFISNEANPASYNFGKFVYTNNPSKYEAHTREAYVVYKEGIYVGYRYSETRYTDCVLKQGNTDGFVYSDNVDFPFGYGLSYTTFSYGDMQLSYDKSSDTYTATVKVTNTGEEQGKEVVQLYLSKPYTDYDKANGIEKAAVELVGYYKTPVINPKLSHTATIRFSGREFASYDAYNAGTYVVDAGDYLLTAAKDSHHAANNILEYLNKLSGSKVFEYSNSKGSKELVKLAKTVSALDATTYAKAAATNNPITNRFDNADLKIYESDNANDRSFEYVSRSNWDETLPVDGVNLIRTDKMDADYFGYMSSALKPDDVKYPTYGAENGLQLVDLRVYKDADGNLTDEKIPYNSELWDDLLDQLTWNDYVNLLSNGLRRTEAIESITKPLTVDHNGANGITQSFSIGSSGLATRFKDPDNGSLPISYPCNGIVAATFNDELIERLGEQWGEECLWAGYSALYGPGLNIHRSQYNGRNFEYYGEDPLLSGKSASAITQGMAKYGAYVYLKHCMLNDQETWRTGVNTWANEQTIREIYLKPFQIAIEEGGAQCVMTGFNSIGAIWTGAQGFVNSVLRGEFGMTGHAVTDFIKTYMTRTVGVMMGNDLPDGQDEGHFDAYKTGYGELAWAMRESAHRILYTVVHSNAMNTYDSNTRIIKIIPAWQIAIQTIEIILGVLFALSAVVLVWQIVTETLSMRAMERDNSLSEDTGGT